MTHSKNNRFQLAAKRLHRHLASEHWTGQCLSGPDVGIRFNVRAGRFIKSYTRFLPWRDNIAYMQAQSYWIMSNWQMLDQDQDDWHRELACACTDYLCDIQTPEGYWEYPNPEWKGRIATVEGCFAVLALLDSYRHTRHQRYLESAVKFYRYLVSGIGFRRQASSDMLAVNYFAHQNDHGGGVPNNATLLLWTLARLAEESADESFLEYATPLANWLTHVQLPSGELPYAVGASSKEDRVHFLCYQYNSFEFMDLVHYSDITKDQSLSRVIGKLSEFLSGGVTDKHACRYSCSRVHPEYLYYNFALARALSMATNLGLGDYGDIAAGVYRNALSEQKEEGHFRFYSRSDYRFLSDRRSYPRNLSMILHQLLSESRQEAGTSAGELVGT